MAEDEQTPSQRLLERPLVMPDVFSGRAGEDFEAWLANFTVSATINKWSDEMQRKMMLVRLRGQAQRFV